MHIGIEKIVEITHPKIANVDGEQQNWITEGLPQNFMLYVYCDICDDYFNTGAKTI